MRMLRSSMAGCSMAFLLHQPPLPFLKFCLLHNTHYDSCSAHFVNYMVNLYIILVLLHIMRGQEVCSLGVITLVAAGY